MKTANSILKIFLVALLLAVQVHFAYAQTAALLPVAPQQFFDKNGNPVSSGSVGYYIPGTSTPKMVWQDDSQTTPWTNPITLNAGGWPPNNKGIYGNGTYRQIIKDKYNNIISDQPTSATGSGGGSGTSVGDGNSVGTILTWSGMIAPNQYQFAYGQALSRSSFPELYQAITLQTPVTCVGGNTTLTGLSDTSNIPIGANVEGNCIVSGTTVLSKTINTVTLSIAANISTSITATFFPYGNGNGLTTFNVPDLRGKVIPGRTNMGGVVTSNLTSSYYGSSPDAVGANGGTQSKLISLTQMPSHRHSVFLNDPGHLHAARVDGAFSVGSGTGLTPVGSGTQTMGAGKATSVGTTDPNFTGITVRDTSGGGGTADQTALTGGSDPISVISPSITMNYIIKVTPDTSISGLFGVASIGGMQGVILCGVGIICAGNIISSASAGAAGANTQVQFNNLGNFGGDSCFIWVNPALQIGVNGTCTGQFKIAGATSGVLTQTVGTIAGTPIITWGNSSGTPAVTASGPLSINTTTGNISITGAALTKTDDTNVTITLGGSSSTALVNAASITLGWTGTLAAGRLNSNVVQSVNNDTNVTGSISTQALSLGWTGTLAVTRGGTGSSTAQTARSGSNLNIDQLTSIGDANTSISATTRVVGTTITFTSARTWTLPAANSVNAGQYLLVADYAGAINGANTLAVIRSGSDTINGSTGITITAVNGAYLFVSDGTSKWTGQSLGAASAGGVSAVTCGTGLTGGTITTSGTCAIDKATSGNLEAGTANKVLTADNIFDPQVTIAYAASQTLDFNTFLNGAITLTGNITSLTCSNMKASQSGVITFTQDATGSRTMVAGWCSQFRWAGGTRGVLSTAANSVDELYYQCKSSSVCNVSLSKGMAN